jgi:large subunit ribosomal protein L35
MEMPKMKTKSSAKKRFKLTASGLVKFKPSNKKHFLRRKPKRMKRQSRRNEVMFEADAKKVIKFFLPNGL